ncbi:hypothetical protein [Kribbella alba]|uniref:hypothetical protein n=1 Tax=Kribbella alba TaxID=190197 RepID=UPI0031D509F1
MQPHRRPRNPLVGIGWVLDRADNAAAGDTVHDTAGDTVRDAVRDAVRAVVRDVVRAVVGDTAGDGVGDVVGDGSKGVGSAAATSGYLAKVVASLRSARTWAALSRCRAASRPAISVAPSCRA